MRVVFKTGFTIRTYIQYVHAHICTVTPGLSDTVCNLNICRITEVAG